MKAADPLRDTFCMLAGMRPTPHSRPGEQFELLDAAPRTQRWLWSIPLSGVLVVLWVMLRG